MKETNMTDPTPRPSDLDQKVEDLAQKADAMDRPDRAIPLPDDDDEGVGPVTGVVP
jgi:hypothetical protein